MGHDGVVALEGVCPADDAETLRQLLSEDPGAAVDWRACEHAHTAVVQVLLVARPAIKGPAGAPLLERWIAPILLRPVC